MASAAKEYDRQLQEHYELKSRGLVSGPFDAYAAGFRIYEPDQQQVQVSPFKLTPPGTLKRKKKMTGSKIIVIVNNGDYGYPSEYDTMEAAQTAAEGLAHKSQSDVYILRPVKKISPKRDVVTVDLPLE